MVSCLGIGDRGGVSPSMISGVRVVAVGSCVGVAHRRQVGAVMGSGMGTAVVGSDVNDFL